MRRRVLIVDDNVVVRSMVRQVFELEDDFEVSGEAENGLEAIQQAERLKPDLIILDLSMPLLSGLEAAPRLKVVLPDVRIILFTVEEGSEVDRLAGLMGIHAVISKHEAVSRLIPEARALMSSLNEGDDPDELRNAS